MKILFVHQNFPGQFKYMAPELLNRGHEVVALAVHFQGDSWLGVKVVQYQAAYTSTPNIHPWVADFESKIIRSDSCFRAAMAMKESGFNPDIIIAHHGWGESLFLKEVWPTAKIGIYCEFFYLNKGADNGFDKEFPEMDLGNVCRLRLKNLHHLLQFEDADAAISPTYWQASTFPKPYRKKIKVIHDGIDTNKIIPNPNIQVVYGGRTFTRHDEVITFVNRNLEPYRGYHIFMRSLPALLQRRPNAHIFIVGGNKVSYGKPAPHGKSWKDIFISEVRSQISDVNWSRVHFLGNVYYDQFLGLLQLSKVHVYLTYPFVLSWSLLEAMSAGCAILASNTAPLEEVIIDKENGRLIDFFDVCGIVDQICELLDDPDQLKRLGSNARKFAQMNYDLSQVCLPKQIEWVEKISSL